MTNILKTIVFFGSGPVAAASLEFLADHFTIEAVVTKEVPAHHKGIAPVEEFARSKGIKIVFANNKSKLDEIIDTHPFYSKLGIVVDFGIIISEKVISSFELGIINSHFSLLPELRGADPISFSILSSKKTTGVSLMLIKPTLDTGDLITQKDLEIQPNETTPDLTKRLIELSNNLLLEYVPKYMNSEIKPYPQSNPERATYTRKLTKSDSMIDLKKAADEIAREVRAFLGWPGSKIQIGDNMITVLGAHVTNKKEDPLDIECGDGKYLSIDKLIAPSGRKMSYRDFINGYLVN